MIDRLYHCLTKNRYDLILEVVGREEMLQRGWHSVAGFSLNRETSDRVVLLFQKREPENCPMFCIAPYEDDIP